MQVYTVASTPSPYVFPGGWMYRLGIWRLANNIHKPQNMITFFIASTKLMKILSHFSVLFHTIVNQVFTRWNLVIRMRMSVGGRRVGVKHWGFFHDNLSFLWLINIKFYRWVIISRHRWGLFLDQLDCKILANLLKIVVLSQTLVFYDNLSFLW